METDNVLIHSMPEEYRANSRQSGDSAKKTGFLILVLGLLFMLLIMGAFYYFLIYDKKEAPVNDFSSAVTPKVIEDSPINSNQSDNRVIKTEDPVETEPVIDEPVAAVSTTTDVKIEESELVATSTDEISETGEIIASSTPETASTSQPIIKGVDTDEDGISDIEESLLGTNLNESDTDQDGFDDIKELAGLYNPLGEGKLEDSNNFARYINSAYGYSFLYPKKISINSVGNDESLVISFDENTFYQIISQTIKAGLDLDSWYKEQFSEDIARVNRKNGLNYITSEDGNTIYLKSDDQEHVIILNYSSIESEKVYSVISELIFNSLETL